MGPNTVTPIDTDGLKSYGLSGCMKLFLALRMWSYLVLAVILRVHVARKPQGTRAAGQCIGRVPVHDPADGTRYGACPLGVKIEGSSCGCVCARSETFFSASALRL